LCYSISLPSTSTHSSPHCPFPSKLHLIPSTPQTLTLSPPLWRKQYPASNVLLGPSVQYGQTDTRTVKFNSCAVSYGVACSGFHLINWPTNINKCRLQPATGCYKLYSPLYYNVPMYKSPIQKLSTKSTHRLSQRGILLQKLYDTVRQLQHITGIFRPSTGHIRPHTPLNAYNWQTDSHTVTTFFFLYCRQRSTQKSRLLDLSAETA